MAGRTCIQLEGSCNCLIKSTFNVEILQCGTFNVACSFALRSQLAPIGLWHRFFSLRFQSTQDRLVISLVSLCANKDNRNSRTMLPNLFHPFWPNIFKRGWICNREADDGYVSLRIAKWSKVSKVILCGRKDMNSNWAHSHVWRVNIATGHLQELYSCRPLLLLIIFHHANCYYERRHISLTWPAVSHSVTETLLPYTDRDAERERDKKMRLCNQPHRYETPLHAGTTEYLFAML